MKISSWVGLCVLTFIGLGSAGCLNTPDPAKLQCKTKAGCPADYFCLHGSCQKGSGAGGTNSDASIDASGGAGGGGGRTGALDAAGGRTGTLDAADGRAGAGGGLDSSTDGRGGSAGDAVSDFPAGLPVGSACQLNGDCQQGHCVDGVCCESICDNGCNACSNAYTGKADGVCAPVTSGQDPHKTCNDETTTNACGADGTCDGLGACRKIGAGQPCGQASCSTDGKTFTPAATCDGKGTCVSALPKTCDPYPCAATGCLVTCDPAATTSACDTGTYCDATTKLCTTQKPDGQPATKPIECTSGVVADGVCCHDPCTGCNACTAALNGQAANTTGQCLPVKAGNDDPHKTCTVGAACGLDGKCDGAGACRYTASGTTCATDACSGSTLTKSTCDGTTHTCASVKSACPNGLICDSATACKASCTANTDCVSGFCSAGTCKTKIVDGSPCTAAGDCQSGNCVAGICCATACGVCNSCATGTCKPADNGKTCDTGKVCNGGFCGACPDGTACNPDGNLCQTGTIACSTGSPVCQALVNAAAGKSCGSGKVCDGSGTCVACTTGTACDTTNLCQIQTTAVSCATGVAQCIATGNKAAGTNCGTNKYCDSLGGCTCTGGACTPSACQTGSYSCATGSPVCTVTGNQPAGTSCGAGKVCDSVGSCVACSSAAACTSNTCEAQTTAVSCTSGLSACVATGNKPVGTNCATNKYCDNFGSCSCTGGACTPSACQTGSYSCATGSPVCTVTGSQPSGTTCGAAGSGQVCDGSGNCGCALGMFACNRCLGWNFESGSTSGWSSDSGAIQLASGTGKGNYSLAVANVNIDNSSISDVTVTISMCASGTSATVPTNGFKLSLDMRFQSPQGLAFGDDGNGGGSIGILVGTDGNSSWTLVNGGSPMTSGAWYHFERYGIPPYGSTTATFLIMRFIPMSPWYGTIFLDNVSLAP